MIARYKYRDLEWIDIESPTHEEVRKIMEEFDIQLYVRRAKQLEHFVEGSVLQRELIADLEA